MDKNSGCIFMDFNSFIGNRAVISQLQALFRQNKVAHAIMLDGAAGLGKKTLAKIIAKTAVCGHREDGVPCGVCSNCKKAEKGIHPDVIFPEKFGVSQTYSIATIRDVRTDAYVAANEAFAKVYIFTDVDNMGLPAQNALLKILEEPPKNVMFILTCESAFNVLATIRSRVQLFSLSPVSSAELQTYLANNFPEQPAEHLKNICEVAKGNIGLALDLVASEGHDKSSELAEKMAFSLASMNEFDLLTVVAQVLENKKDFIFVLKFLSDLLRDALVLSVDFSIAENSGCAKILAEKLSTAQLLRLIDVVTQTRNYVERNVNMQILSMDFCSKMFQIAANAG